jgi:hypothetical protein
MISYISTVSTAAMPSVAAAMPSVAKGPSGAAY